VPTGPAFEDLPFEELPLECDTWLMDEKWLPDWEKAWQAVFAGKDISPYQIGYISYISINSISDEAAEIEWFANIHTRFHAVQTYLPRRVFRGCFRAWEYEKRATVFVDGAWLNRLHDRTHSTFALVDACGFGSMLKRDAIEAGKILKIRNEVDILAAANPTVAFTSFADSLLLKTNWNIGRWDNPTVAEYQPESLLKLLAEIDDIYRFVLGVSTYAALAQGNNDLFGDELFHVAKSGNHVSLNSLGLPFAQIRAIEDAARDNIRAKVHGPSEVYIDRTLFWSMNIDDHDWKSAQKSYHYDQKLVSKRGRYVALSRTDLATALAA
jgi:hypothetical protein